MLDKKVLVAKRELRAKMRERRRSVPPADRAKAAEGLATMLRALPGIGERRDMLGTIGVGTEIDPRLFCESWIEEGKNLYLPRVESDGVSMLVCHVASLAHCRPGFRDCPEPDVDFCKPASLAGIDLILLPGLAFDRRGNRLGQGGGHYDRLLARRQANALVVGVAYDFQVIDAVPSDGELDQPVDWIVTQWETHCCSG